MLYKDCTTSENEHLVSKLLAPSLVAFGTEAMSGRQGLSQLGCNGPCIACQAEGGPLHIPLPRGHVCQDELDAAAPLGSLPKVQLPV